jgi:hypothetical protein
MCLHTCTSHFVLNERFTVILYSFSPCQTVPVKHRSLLPPPSGYSRLFRPWRWKQETTPEHLLTIYKSTRCQIPEDWIFISTSAKTSNLMFLIVTGWILSIQTGCKAHSVIFWQQSWQDIWSCWWRQCREVLSLNSLNIHHTGKKKSFK